MISEIKTLLEATGQFVDVQLASDLQPVENMTDNVPSAIVYRADTNYGESTVDNLVYQAADKIVEVIFICLADDVETFENLVVTTLLGYQYSAQHGGLEAVKAVNYKIAGHHYARRVIFQTRTHVSES